MSSGFNDAVRELIEAFRDERFQHASPGSNKGLLAAGHVTPANVAAELLAESGRGPQLEKALH